MPASQAWRPIELSLVSGGSAAVAGCQTLQRSSVVQTHPGSRAGLLAARMLSTWRMSGSDSGAASMGVGCTKRLSSRAAIVGIASSPQAPCSSITSCSLGGGGAAHCLLTSSSSSSKASGSSYWCTRALGRLLHSAAPAALALMVARSPAACSLRVAPIRTYNWCPRRCHLLLGLGPWGWLWCGGWVACGRRGGWVGGEQVVGSRSE